MARRQPGAIALLGSGEYTRAMEQVDQRLLETLGGPDQAHVVVLPTASGLEPGMPEQWNARGVAHFRRLGVHVTPVPLITRADAHDPAIVALLAQANILYLSGGNPQYAIDTWRDSPAWDMLRARWQAGAVVAGCSAGAMMIGGATINIRQLINGQPPTWQPALGLVPQIVTLPHFDRMQAMITPQLFRTLIDHTPAGFTVIGVDEDTALVHDGDTQWRVDGLQTVSIFDAQGNSTRFPAGATVTLA